MRDIAPGASNAPVPPEPKRSVVSMRTLIIALVALVAIAAAITGVRLASSNSDIACSRTLTDEGACTSGSWGAWQTVSQTANGCTTLVQERRTYTGMREIIRSSFNYRTVSHVACDINWANRNRGTVTGTITYQYAACQIQNDRTRSTSSTAGTCAGTVPASTEVSNTSAVTTGSITSETNASGSYQEYLDAVEARLATSSITAVPLLVHAGDTTDVSWSASRVRSCTVTGTNGDSWTSAPAAGSMQNAQNTDANGPSQGGGQTAQQQAQQTSGSIYATQQSSPILQQTVYTLTCTRAAGNPLVSTVTVNIIPTFQEL